jgi:hypothetical protein
LSVPKFEAPDAESRDAERVLRTRLGSASRLELEAEMPWFDWKGGDDIGAYIVRATNSTIPSQKRSPAPNDQRSTECGTFHTIGGS